MAWVQRKLLNNCYNREEFGLWLQEWVHCMVTGIIPLPQLQSCTHYIGEHGSAGMLVLARRPSRLSTRWQRNHTGFHLEKESQSSNMFPSPLGPEKK